MERACRPLCGCKLVLHPEKTRIVYCRTGVATSRTNPSIFSVSVSERGKRCGKVFFPRTASCPPPPEGTHGHQLDNPAMDASSAH